MNETLQNWLNNGWLIEHQTSQQEVADLLSVTERDLHDCRLKDLSPDWRFNIAYNAALQVAKLALAVTGFQAAKEAQHFRVIQSLAYTVKVDNDQINQFDAFRKKRNRIGYEVAGSVSDQEVAEIIDLAQQLDQRIKTWLKVNFPNFIP